MDIRNLDDIIVRIMRTEFEKLSRPYNDRCQVYDRSNQFKCINNCFKEKFDCTPNINLYHSINLKHDIYKGFCREDHDVENQKTNYEKCHDICLPDCKQKIYHISKTYKEHDNSLRTGTSNMTTTFLIDENYFEKIIWYPKLTFMDLLINIANTINLWHGTSFFSVFSMSVLYNNNILREINGMFSIFLSKINFRKPKINIKNFKICFLIVTTLIFFRQIISITIDYTNYKTNTRLDKRENDQDKNQPFISITFEEVIKYKFFNVKMISERKLYYDFDDNYNEYQGLILSPNLIDESPIKYTEYILKRLNLSGFIFLNATILFQNAFINNYKLPSTLGFYIEPSRIFEDFISRAIYSFQITEENIKDEVIFKYFF